MMRTTSYLLTVMLASIFFVERGFAQCVAFAGNDTLVCAGQPIQLTGASVTGGTPPYSYAWNCRKLSSFHTALDYIEDTTVLHPTIILMPGNSFYDYWLTVIDAVGDTCRDTISVQYSYPITTVSADTDYINPGDSINLNISVSGSFPPFTYQWEPDSSLSNMNTANPVAFPTQTTTYAVTTTNSIGCTRVDSLTIHITGVGFESRHNKGITFDLLPNPTNNEIWLTLSKNLPDLEVSLFDSKGTRISSFNTYGKTIQIDTKDLRQGVFFILVQQAGQVLGTRRFVKL